jgi:transcriptional regulator with XRE-family HTH domain
MEHLGELIKQRRKERKLSQAELASLVGMSRATISGIENNTCSEIGVRKLEKLMLAVGLRLTAEPIKRRPTVYEVRSMNVHE